MKKNVVNILLLIVVLILIALNIIIYINNHKEDEEEIRVNNTITENNLSENIKQSYFKTLEEFEQYVQKYPENIVVDYQDINREGEIFILTVEIKDLYDSQAETIKQRVVVKAEAK